jgi:hypothetical protein
MASDLLDEETRLLTSNNQQQAKIRKYEPPLDGIALSGFALVLGIGVFLFLPWIGLVLVCIGMVGLVLSLIFNAPPKTIIARLLCRGLSITLIANYPSIPRF